MKGFKFMVSYEDYGQSDMYNGKFKTLPTNDVNEIDMVIIFKPISDITLKLFNVNHTSEYNSGKTRELKIIHQRIYGHLLSWAKRITVLEILS